MNFFLFHPAQVKSAYGCKNAWRCGRLGAKLLIDVSFKTTCPLTEGMKAVDSNIH